MKSVVETLKSVVMTFKLSLFDWVEWVLDQKNGIGRSDVFCNSNRKAA